MDVKSIPKKKTSTLPGEGETFRYKDRVWMQTLESRKHRRSKPFYGESLRLIRTEFRPCLYIKNKSVAKTPMGANLLKVNLSG